MPKAENETRYQSKQVHARDFRNWVKVDPTKVLKGQAIQARHDAILDAIDVLSRMDAAAKEAAKSHSSENGHFCIVVGDPRPETDEQGNERIMIPVVHCTKGTYSHMRDVLYRPLPHSSNLWANYGFKRPPLEVTKSSPEFEHQTYVIPYQVFEVAVKPGHHVLVSISALYVKGKRIDISAMQVFKGFRLTTKAVGDLHSDIEENKPIVERLKQITATTDPQKFKKLIANWRKDAGGDSFLHKGMDYLELSERNDAELQKQLEEVEKAVEMDPAYAEELQGLIKEAQKRGLPTKLRESADFWQKFNLGPEIPKGSKTTSGSDIPSAPQSESAKMWGNFDKKALSGNTTDSGSGGASVEQDAGAKSTDSGPKKKKPVSMRR